MKTVFSLLQHITKMSVKVKKENLEEDANENLDEEVDIKYHHIEEIIIKQENTDGNKIYISRYY